SGGSWQYRIDGGAWTNHGQTLHNNNKIIKFYISGAASTVDFRAFDGSGSVGCFPASVEWYWLAPTTTQGFVWHNLGSTTQRMNYLAAATSGDRMAVLDAVTLGTGSPLNNRPNVGTLAMFINDINIGNTTTWNTDLTTFYNRVSPYGPVGLMSPWE